MRALLMMLFVLINCAWQYPGGWQSDFPFQSSGDGTGNIVSSPSTANVGIGTTLAVPNKLYVVGDIVATGNVTGSGSTSSGPLLINNVASFSSEFNIGANIGIGTTNVNWDNGNAQNVGIGTNGTNTYITFTHPSRGSYATLNLRIKQDGTGNRALPSGAWPATVLWSGGTAPTLTTTAGKSDIITCKWNGTNDYCAAAQNF